MGTESSGRGRAEGAALVDTQSAVFEYDDARIWLTENGASLDQPLAVEVWVFDPDLQQVVLVDHRWRGWVPPGGKVEPDETPREGASRELLEETGLRVELSGRPAAAAIRSYHPEWPSTLGLSYAAIADPSERIRGEVGQAVCWMPLSEAWVSVFPDDICRMRAYARWFIGVARRSLASPDSSRG